MAITAPDSMAETLMISLTYKTFWFTEPRFVITISLWVRRLNEI
jgi:hypothetical protein